MKMDETVDIIRKRFGFYSVQRGLMYRDRILSAVMQSLIIRYIRMGTLDRQEGLNYYGKRQDICKCHG